MNRNLLILGAGQYGTVVKEIAKSMECFEKIDFLDDTFG
ncbi:MAG: acetyltransferase, partial [Clostridia bacterium]|nr:acetyltransferase [Clostridia bacterium]